MIFSVEKINEEKNHDNFQEKIIKPLKLLFIFDEYL